MIACVGSIGGAPGSASVASAQKQQFSCHSTGTIHPLGIHCSFFLVD